MRAFVAAALAALLAIGPALAEGDARNGRKLFRQCAACHTLEATKREKFGPSLDGIFGRKAAMVDAYPYSEALRSAGIVWDEATLDAWIADPRAYVPGVAMTFPGIADPADRADLIAYLRIATAR